MLPLFEHLQEAVALKRFLEELKKNPLRTLLALAAVFLVSGGAVNAAYQAASGPAAAPPVLSTLPTQPAQPGADGTLTSLPYPAAAEAALQAIQAETAARRQQLAQQLASRPADAAPSAEEIRLLNESGQVHY
ncbi:hypothetical protein [Vogesella mureinivorans]|uniref:hypothetical protein n=1 Tax=Vogesella mureinivorans TaxID=657276 RepID=UPI0011CB4EF0|nr:hypothetical protein [Vogesella mureinivorans]